MWSGTEESTLLLDTAARFARVTFASEASQNGHAEQSLSAAIAAADQQGLLRAPLAEDAGGMDLPLIDQCKLIAQLAMESAAFATILANHFSALGALREMEGASDKFMGVHTNSPNGTPPYQPGTVPLIGLSFADALQPNESLCPIEPQHCSHLIVADPEGLSLHDATQFATCCSKQRWGSGLEGLWANCLPADSRQSARACVADRNLARRTRSRWLLLLAAAQSGNAAAACSIAVTYAKERRQTGRLIVDHQSVRAMLATMIMQVNAAESFVWRAADDPDAFRGPFDLCTQAYRFAGDLTEQICLDAVQVLGGYGYMKDNGTERRLRDCKTLQALAGDHISNSLASPQPSPSP